MESVKKATGWGQDRSMGHIRSLSHLRQPSPKLDSSTSSLRSSRSVSTLPDISTLGVPQSPHKDADTVQHPDLSDEVAALSRKLVNAINLQTSLDDTLSETRHELEVANARIRELEALVAKQRETLESDVWIRRSSVEPEKELLRARVREMKKLKDAVEAEKHEMEDELSTLATEAIAEGHKLVVTEREQAKEREDHLHQKIDQLRNQVSDYEEMFKAQQEQLIDLRQTMDHMLDRENRSSSVCPSSPGLSGHGSLDDDSVGSDEGLYDSPIEPAAPLSYTHLIQPLMLDDGLIFEEFAELAKMSRTVKKLAPGGHSRGLSGFASLGMGLGGNPYSASVSNSSAGSLAAPSSTTMDSSPQTPNTPASSANASPTTSSPVMHLRDTRIYKRFALEDIDATLRLGEIHWLSRRGLSNAFIDGTVVIEPLDGSESEIRAKQGQACTLCHKSEKKDQEYTRTHQFGISSESTRLPLCAHCLRRVRSTCGLLNFLRMVKEGHWRTDSDQDLMAAWEECTRLREQMFWARAGGGVVPAAYKQRVQLCNRHVNNNATPVSSDAVEPNNTKQESEQIQISLLNGSLSSQNSAVGRPGEPEQPGTPLGPLPNTSIGPLREKLRERSSSTLNVAPTTARTSVKRLSLNIPMGVSFM